MRHATTPVVKDLVLVGGGHSHVTVLKRFGMCPMPGVRVTVICRDVHTPYSGMLPGLIAGHYTFDETHIDLGPLSRFADARLLHEEVVGIDPEARVVRCRSHPPVPYDLLSVNIGSTPSFDEVPGAREHVVPVKPIQRFLARWEGLVDRVLASDRALRIAVVGAGAGGIEIALTARYRLDRILAEAGRPRDDVQLTVFGSGDEILTTHPQPVQRAFRRILRERDVDVRLGTRVASIEPDRLRTADGEEHAIDEVLWVTNAGAAPWLRETGLALDDRGFLQVDASLRSTSHPAVFAAGDCASVVDHPREKAGVFAVRQGPPLERNLRRALVGQDPIAFRPQRTFLTIISTGDRYAIASKGPLSVEGSWVWRWKDRIDRRFMEKFNELPPMEDADASPQVAPGLASEEVLREISTLALRCGGCGAKVGATVLEQALARLDLARSDDVLIGLGEPDDAAVVRVPEGHVVVQTVDSFRAIVDDPYTFGKIAANHALGDVFAMGADPRTAMAIATVPYGPEEKTVVTLEELLGGANEVLRECGAVLVGGHTSEGAELTLGFSIHATALPEQILRKGGLRPGDRLLLTKPVGTGTLFAAHMRRRAKGRWIVAATESMLQSSRAAAECLRRHGATACTDVTGFGVLGHLVEMLRASGLDAEIDLDRLPVLLGAEDCVAAGILSSLQPQNLRLRRAVADLERVSRHPRWPLLFDPQTAGGLLAGVPGHATAACLDELRVLGYESAALLGVVRDGGTTPELVRVTTGG